MKKRNLYIAAYNNRYTNRLRKALKAVRAYASGGQKSVFLIVPMLCVGKWSETLRVPKQDAERQYRHSHAERGNDVTLCV